jgi:hypothetical protein
MSTDIVRIDTVGLIPRSEAITNVQQLGELLAKSGYFSDAREYGQAAVKVMAGAELGIPPIASMMGISIIKGKVAMGANLMASRVRAHGYDFKVVRLESDGCTLDFLSKPDATGKRSKLGTSSFTEADAKQAGVYSDMYKKFPRNMLFARAVSNGTKWFTPEVTSGMPVYLPEELGATVDEDGEVIAMPQAQNDVAQRRIKEEQAKLDKQREEASPINGGPLDIGKMVKGFEALKERLGPHTSLYYDLLRNFGVKHSNEFRDKDRAKACYREMEALVKKYEAQRETDMAGEGQPVDAEVVA